MVNEPVELAVKPIPEIAVVVTIALLLYVYNGVFRVDSVNLK
ncbi:hypothetical protein AQBE111736_13700 [Aquirufa beregesia]